MSRRLAQSCGLLGLCVVAGKHAAHCATVKTFKSNPHMMRGVKVKAESYEISFEGCGSVRVFRACDPPYEISFPQWSLKKSVSRSEVAVESVRALCSGELKDGTSCALLARAILLPDGAFKKIVVVSNLRKLLKEHLPKGSFKSIREAGSTLYRLDVDGSDHDIEVVFRGEAADHRIAEMLLEGLLAAQADAQERVESLRTRSKDYHELARAQLQPFEYGVQIRGYPEGTEWDVVATKWEPGSPAHVQYDSKQQRWKPMLSGYVKPVVEGWWTSKMTLFLALKLLKMWNANLPKLRRKRCERTGSWWPVSPLSSFHLVLMAIAAAPQWDDSGSLQAACCFLLRFVQDHWHDVALDTGIPTAEQHLSWQKKHNFQSIRRRS
ncbi:unnamed protein product [Symbiodinium natans]|uniref:Uncharacterized protein n=1 Tax=Symbiodinium natans TaxID=878477 RepID=A0A812I885_9DINO|nr:unnamed protein product [Symbiodinium natans]